MILKSTLLKEERFQHIYNLNGYFRQADVTFPVAYKSGTIPNVCASVINYGNTNIDVRLSVLVKRITNTGVSINIGDSEGELEEQGYNVKWISVGEI